MCFILEFFSLCLLFFFLASPFDTFSVFLFLSYYCIKTSFKIVQFSHRCSVQLDSLTRVKKVIHKSNKHNWNFLRKKKWLNCFLLLLSFTVNFTTTFCWIRYTHRVAPQQKHVMTNENVYKRQKRQWKFAKKPTSW